jgi:hypothetical protein
VEAAELETRWRRGDPVPGVAYGNGAHVRILDGPFAEECAFVRDLIALEPEPCYCVEVDAAHVRLEVAESALGTV